MKKIRWDTPLPKCDVCQKAEAGRFDAKSIMGPWGNFCHPCLMISTSPEGRSIGYERITE